MSRSNPLMVLSKRLARKDRIETLRTLRTSSRRNVDVAGKLKLRKERVSESFKDLAELRLVLRFLKESIIGEKHTFYTATPFGLEILELNERLPKIQKVFPESISDFGDGIAYILKYYMDIEEMEVMHDVVITRRGRRIDLTIKLKSCSRDSCEITCIPLIKSVVKKFGQMDEIEHQKSGLCTFSTKFWLK